jgi:PEP-CTERM motif-containing protein
MKRIHSASMARSVFLLGLALFIAGQNVGRADSITTFDVTGTFVVPFIIPPSEGTVFMSGTMTADTTTGIISSALLTLVGPPISAFPEVGNTFSVASPPCGGTSESPAEVTICNGGTTEGSFANLVLRFPVPSLVNYAGGPLCSLSFDNCGIGGLFLPLANALLHDGSVTPVPEPSSVLLMLTGLAGACIYALYSRWRGKELLD